MSESGDVGTVTIAEIRKAAEAVGYTVRSHGDTRRWRYWVDIFVLSPSGCPYCCVTDEEPLVVTGAGRTLAQARCRARARVMEEIESMKPGAEDVK